MVTLFLTMLVGAGGNAGNQSAIKVIRGLVGGGWAGGSGMGAIGRVVTVWVLVVLRTRLVS